MNTRKLVATGVGAIAVLGVAHLAWLRPYLKRKRMARNEILAITALRAYLGAQGKFQSEDRYGKDARVYANPEYGSGFPDLYRIGGPDGTGEVLGFIDIDFARATSPETAKDGYWFVDIVGDKEFGDYDFTNACGLCAVPAVYGETGISTFVVDLSGTVYPKDNKGTPVRIYPDVGREGWLLTCP